MSGHERCDQGLSRMPLGCGVALRMLLPVMVLAMALTWFPGQAYAGESAESHWYVGAGARVMKLEGFQEGYGGSLLLGWKLPYRHAEAARSSIALEFDLTATTDPLSRRSDGGRAEADLRQGGAYLALNTFVTERVFHRVRLGGVVRHLDNDVRSRTQGRLVFGFGLGLRLTERLDVLADAQTQYWSFPDDLLHEGGVTARWHF